MSSLVPDGLFLTTSREHAVKKNNLSNNLLLSRSPGESGISEASPDTPGAGGWRCPAGREPSGRTGVAMLQCSAPSGRHPFRPFQVRRYSGSSEQAACSSGEVRGASGTRCLRPLETVPRPSCRREGPCPPTSALCLGLLSEASSATMRPLSKGNSCRGDSVLALMRRRRPSGGRPWHAGPVVVNASCGCDGDPATRLLAPGTAALRLCEAATTRRGGPGDGFVIWSPPRQRGDGRKEGCWPPGVTWGTQVAGNGRAETSARPGVWLRGDPISRRANTHQ